MTKLMDTDAIAATLRDGMTLGIGGWGSRRKPMALVRALCRTAVRDLTVVSYGGPDVGLLCAAGKVRRVVAPFVTLDSLPLDPFFRAARQNGEVEFTEYDEGMFLFGLLAAAHRLPFLPTPAGIGSGIMAANPHLKTVASPYPDGPDADRELVAMPPLHLDAAFLHTNRADARGNGQYLGTDPFMDDLFAKAAERTYLSAERIVDSFTGPVQSLLINRSMVAGVAEAPGGADFTECLPDYGRDEEFQRAYAAAAASPQAWAEFGGRYIAEGVADAGSTDARKETGR